MAELRHRTPCVNPECCGLSFRSVVLLLQSKIHAEASGSTSEVVQSTNLVGGFNPSEKYARQIGSFPQVGVKIKNVWNHHLVMAYWWFGSWWFGFRLDPLMKGIGDSFSISWFKAVENIFVKMGIFPNFLGGVKISTKNPLKPPDRVRTVLVHSGSSRISKPP